MKLIKHMQSCVVIEDEGVQIVFDPGAFDHKVERVINGANAVFITHDHMDHFDQAAVEKALGDNDGLKVYGPASVTGKLGAFGGRVMTVTPGEDIMVGSVKVSVVGTGKHAEIHASLPVAQNVGYIINDRVYHPGDSFDVPEQRIETLLLPTSGPWLKTGEAADFALAVKPQRMVAIHDALDSEYGDNLTQSQLGQNGITGIELIQLKPSKSINL